MEEDEVLRLMRDVGAHATAYDAVPGRLVHGVELGLDDLRDVVEDGFLLERELAAVDGVLLHTLGHICVLDDGHFRLLLRDLLQLL